MILIFDYSLFSQTVFLKALCRFRRRKCSACIISVKKPIIKPVIRYAPDQEQIQ